jgi:hypothetical protein
MLALTFAVALALGSQQVELQEVRLHDGSVVYGTIVESDAERVRIRTVRGVELDVARAEIASMEPAEGEVVAGEYQARDPNATRLLFAPTGRSLERGDGYIGVFEVSMPFVQVGITDRFSIGAGTPLVFGFDESQRPFWITPKFQFVDRPRVKAAAGVMHIVAPEVGSIGIGYGVVTVGRHDRAVTIGTGVGYRNHEDDGGATAIVMLGGERTVRRGIKLITENYVWAGGDGMVSGAVRFFGDRLSADLGVAIPIGVDALVAVPIVNVVWTF